LSQQTKFYVVANGIKQHYLEFGFSGPPLLIIPGITSPAAMWAFVAERLAHHAHVYVMDVRGRGLSDHSPGLSYTFDDYAADADALLDCLGISSAIVLGHSLGARSGIRLAGQHPARVNRLIMVDPPMSGRGRRSYPRPLSFYLDAIRAAERGESISAPTHWTGEQVQVRTQWLPTCSDEAVIASIDEEQNESVHAEVSGIQCPALMLCADQGGVVADEDIDEIRDNNPKLQVRRMSGVGHMVPWDDLEQFISLVKEFIEVPPAS